MKESIWWRILGHTRHVLLVGALYMFAVGMFDLDWPMLDQTRLQTSLAIAWMALWREFGRGLR